MKKIVILICLILILCSGCSADHSLMLGACGSFAVPGMHCGGMYGDTFSCEILETDKMGRVLFSYTAHSQVTNEVVTVQVICQQIQGETVCFYEDICYLFDDGELGTFKTRNDWGQPLNPNKMSRRQVDISFDGYLVVDTQVRPADIKAHCAQLLGVGKEALRNLCIQDVDEQGNGLYWLEVDMDERECCFFLFVSPECEVVLLPVQRDQGSLALLPEFKADNGWSYPETPLLID